MAHIVFVVGHDGDVCVSGRRGCCGVLKWLSWDAAAVRSARVVVNAVAGVWMWRGRIAGRVSKPGSKVEGTRGGG